MSSISPAGSIESSGPTVETAMRQDAAATSLLEPAPARELMENLEAGAIGISLVIPLYNEAESLDELHSRLTTVLTGLGKPYELIFIDDGSSDNSPEVLRNLAAADPHARIFRFRRNLGKAAALAVGFQRALGDIIITMDADLQDEPSEIPHFLAALDQGQDMVSGWKKKRLDPLGKTAPSKVFNWVTRKMTGLDLHDFNCGFKAYRRGVVEHLDLYGELHRYIPALAYWKGFRVGEIPVEHHPRVHGVSKYGWERFLRGLFDLITVVFLTRYIRKPLHFFGAAGFLLLAVGFIIGIVLTCQHFMGVPIHDRPLLVLSVLMMILGVQFVSTGLIAELLVSQRGGSGYDEYLVD